MTDQPGNSPDDAPLENTPFVLYPLRVPRGTQPVVGGDCGAPRHIFDPAPNNPGLKELELQIDPFLSQQRGDRVAINANNELDIVNTLTQSDNDTVTLYLPEKMLEPDIVNIPHLYRDAGEPEHGHLFAPQGVVQRNPTRQRGH
ncbi:hypothetical protein [Pseudomonas sp. BE134]|uniref:hypothetical protein n=1 Tax=Pseudomonas sp. BE134 TaxID=2817843 RepID=UPI00285A7933|nr:hypothetical protein [Pseudomonas sp. BE134]MDR6925693.1 hypothetical protein [Pseudomonas sp. BE134]